MLLHLSSAQWLMSRLTAVRVKLAHHCAFNPFREFGNLCPLQYWPHIVKNNLSHAIIIFHWIRNSEYRLKDETCSMAETTPYYARKCFIGDSSICSCQRESIISKTPILDSVKMYSQLQLKQRDFRRMWVNFPINVPIGAAWREQTFFRFNLCQKINWS